MNPDARVVQLKSGTITIECVVDVFNVAAEDMQFLYELRGLIAQYEERAKAESDRAKVEAENGR